MSKRVNQLLLAAALAASSFVLATGHGSYLTILNGDADQRSVVSIKGMNDSAEDACCSSIAMRLVYGRTWDSANLAQFFAPNSATSNVFTAKAVPTASDVALNLVARVPGTGADGTMDDATITLNPVSTRMAVGLSYAQDLKNVMEGAWFDLGLSFARVENDLKAVIVGGAKNTVTDDLSSFFKGTTFVPGDALTSTLNNGRIPTVKNDSATGVEEVAMRLGYNFVTNDTGSMGGYISGVVGLGTEPKLVNLFESVVGHRHLHLGAGLQGDISLSQTDEHSMSSKLDAKAHYIFSRDAIRMGRLTDLTVIAGNSNYQQYYLVKDTTAGATAGWMPGANAITRTVTVNPKYSAQLGAQFVYSNDCTSFDLGYNLEYRAKEDNKLVGAWNDAQYVVAGLSESSNRPVAVAGTDIGVAIKAANVNWNEDSKILHTVHGGVNYSFCDMANPMNLGLGGSISMANDRQAGEGHWSVFAKLGLSF